MIKINNLSYQYKEGNVGLSNINLEFKRGEITCIIGPNGSGKSTLLNTIANLNKYDGEILLDEQNIQKVKNIELRQKIGIVFQNPNTQIIFNKVSDDIKFTLNNLKMDNVDERIKKSLKLTKMEEFIDANPYNLSGGEKQRLALSSVLALDPEFLLLDEVTSMIDYNGKQAIYDILKDLKKNKIGIIMTTNIIDELILADKIVILNNNHEISNVITKKELFNDLSLLKDFYIPLKFKLINKIGYDNLNNLDDEEILNYVFK